MTVLYQQFVTDSNSPLACYAIRNPYEVLSSLPFEHFASSVLGPMAKSF